MTSIRGATERIRHMAIIVPNGVDGSVGAVAWRHARLLSQSFHVHLISRAIPDIPHDRIHPVRLCPLQWSFLRRFSHVPNALSFELAARLSLAKLCKQTPISTVWCHGHASVVLAAAPCRPQYGFHIVMTTHGDIRDRPPGTYSRELTWYYRFLTCKAYRRSDIVQALSPYMAELARSGGALNVCVIPNGIDPSDVGLPAVPARADASYCPDGRVRLLFVGNLLPVKGVDVLLKALATIHHHGLSEPGSVGRPPLPMPHLTIVGDGPERMAYGRLAANLGIAERVSFLGHVARRDLGAVYASFDVLCIPSRSEPLPTAGMEAMMCGLPILGSRTGGLPSMVEVGKTGWLCTPGSVEDLARGLREACHSMRQLPSLGAAAQQVARTRFNWDHIGVPLKGLVS